ncbi:unnamed protein product [Urochloa humidicola]
MYLNMESSEVAPPCSTAAVGCHQNAHKKDRVAAGGWDPYAAVLELDALPAATYALVAGAPHCRGAGEASFRAAAAGAADAALRPELERWTGHAPPPRAAKRGSAGQDSAGSSLVRIWKRGTKVSASASKAATVASAGAAGEGPDLELKL